MDSPSRVHVRERHALLAGALTNGPAELIDFVLPLWAGVALGATPTQVGLLVGAEMAVSVVARPLAGVLADVRERRAVAAAGALLYALSCLTYALAGSLPAAFGAAVLGGVGGALLWVALRAIVGERLADDSSAYARLLSAQETGSWIAFVAGMTLIGMIDYRGVFLACAGACAVAAAALAVAPRMAPAGRGDAGTRARGLAVRLRPMLLAVVLTMTAESAVALLLLLHLQRGFDLEVVEIAYVFLPGAIAMSLAPEPLHRLVVRRGRRAVLATASVASAAFALSLAWAPSPAAIAGLWILSGLAWAAIMPIQQAVVAEVSGPAGLGRGMGLYEAATLVGGLLGAVAAGVLYETGSWTAACVVAAAVILAGAVVVPRAVAALGAADLPPAPPARPREPEPAPPGPAARPAPEAAASPAPKPARERLRDLGGHVALFLAGQVALAIGGASWILGHDRADGLQGVLHGAGRIWVFVLAVDGAWTALEIMRARRRGAGGPSPGPDPGA